MNGEIDKDGTLLIARAGQMQKQYCYFSNAAGEPMSYCSHCCPHFGEPEAAAMPQGSATRLSLCHGKVLYFSKFTDHRKQPTCTQDSAAQTLRFREADATDVICDQPGAKDYDGGEPL